MELSGTAVADNGGWECSDVSCHPVGLQPTDIVPWGRPGSMTPMGTGRSLSSGRATRGPVGRCDKVGGTGPIATVFN